MQDDTSQPAPDPRGPGTADEPVGDTTPGSRTGTRTDEGTAACDTMNSIVRTAKKLGVSAFEYMRDRVSRLFRLPSLADMIRRRAAAAARS